MIINLHKYGWLWFFGVGFLFKINFIISESVVTVIFYVTMILGLVSVLSLLRRLKYSQFRRKYFAIILLVFLTLAHTILVPLAAEQFLYISARIAIFSLAINALESNRNFYEKFFRSYFTRIILLLIYLGWQFGADSGFESERLTLGFNANDLGIFGTLGLVTYLFFNRSIKLRIEPILTISVCTIVILYSASKAAFFLAIIGLVILYRASFKSLASLSLVGVVLLYLINVEELYIWERLNNQASLFETRDATFDAAIRTWQNNKWLGHGSHKYDWTDPAFWPRNSVAYGPHNAYLSLLIMYGVIIGGMWLAILVYFFWCSAKRLMKPGVGLDSYAALMIILIFLSGLSESVIVGINEVLTALFWFLVVVLLNQSSKEVVVHD